MECSQVRTILLREAEIDASSHLPRDVQDHLAGCENCMAFLDALNEQYKVLRTLPRREAPPDFLAKVRLRVAKPRPTFGEKIRSAVSSLFSGRYLFRFVATAATAILVVTTAHIALKDSGMKLKTSAPAPLSPAPHLGSVPPELPRSERIPSGSKAEGFGLQDEEQVQSRMEIQTRGEVLDRPRSPSEERSVSRKSLLGRSEGAAPKPSVALTLKLQIQPSGNKSSQSAEPSAMQPALESAEEMPVPERTESFTGTRKGELGAGRAKPAARQTARELTDSSRHGAELKQRPRALVELEPLVRQAGGKILDEPHFPGTSGSSILHVEIPAEKYLLFLDLLRGIGDLEHPRDRISPPADLATTVDVRLEIRE